ncbi:MAG: LTA synthase family protein [Mariprofundaceae bacterium]|nr:LTA synthase family protein [Mariprofundaceae bacterium]
MQDKLFYWQKSTYFTLFFITTSVMLFFVARVAFVGQHGGDGMTSSSLLDALWWGFRVDLKVAALMSLPFYLLLVMGIAFTSKYAAHFFTSYRFILYVLLLFNLFLAVINHFYYFNFQNHIDIFIFDFLSWENTKAVSYTIWQDYPVVPASLLMLCLAWLLFKLLTYFELKSDQLGKLGQQNKGKWVKTHVLLMVFALIIAGRGSLGVFPLMLTHISITGDLLLTRAVANGPAALAEAWVEWTNMSQLQAVSDEAYEQAYQTWFDGENPQALVENNIQSKLKILPNVLFFQMESMGGHLANLHSDDNPLLGRLAKHQREDMWFNNFISSTKGTLGSVEKLLANSGVSNVSESAYRKHTFSATPASLFKKMGYHTIFLTGGTKTWSNLNEFLSNQGFDEILDVQDIQQALPHAQHDGVWGVFDAFSFEYVLKLLQEKHGKPLFIYTMTMTNHSPYILPQHATEIPLYVPKAYQSKVFQGDMEKAELVLQSYHYAANELGLLMDKIKAGSLQDNTIVAATGDHYMRDIFNYYRDEGDILYQYQVPLYLYLPPLLRADVDYDAQRFGSHKDIFPTIFSRLLQSNPLHTGQDLLTDTAGVAIREEFALSKAGAVLKLGNKPIYYQWQDGFYQHLRQIAVPTPALKTLADKHQAYAVLLRWQTMQDSMLTDKMIP